MYSFLSPIALNMAGHSRVSQSFPILQLMISHAFRFAQISRGNISAGKSLRAASIAPVRLKDLELTMGRSATLHRIPK